MNFFNTASEKQLNLLSSLVLACAFLISLGTLFWLSIYCHFGLDLTDESYYLVWMKNPWLYSLSVSQFGFIYHPLYLLFNGDIALLRQANLVLIFFLSFWLCFICFKKILKEYNVNLFVILTLSTVLSSTSLIYFCPFGWLATPSYNSLNFQSILLASIGLLTCEKKIDYKNLISCLLIALGIWLDFMAKPTSSVLLIVSALIFLYSQNKLTQSLFICVFLSCIALALISAWIIDGSIANFVNRLKNGADMASTLSPVFTTKSLIRVDSLIINSKEYWFMFYVFIVTIISFFLINNKIFLLNLFGFILLFIFLITDILMITADVSLPVSETRETHSIAIILIIPVIVVFISLFQKIKIVNLKCILYFTVLPCLFAFGTGNNNWILSSSVALFWLLATAFIFPAIIKNRHWSMILPIVLLAQLVSICLLQTAIKFPYRQPEPLPSYTHLTTIGAENSQLMLPFEVSDYFQKLKAVAKQAEFSPETPMIDLTGEGPGTLYGLGAKSIGLAWFIGGQVGSEKVAIQALSRVLCIDIANAWLLIDADNSLKLSPTILHTFGINLEKDFFMVAKLDIPTTNTPRHGIPVRALEFWKPINSIQHISSCKQNEVH